MVQDDTLPKAASIRCAETQHSSDPFKTGKGFRRASGVCAPGHLNMQLRSFVPACFPWQ